MRYIKIELSKDASGIVYPSCYHTVPLDGGGYLEEKETGKTCMILWGKGNIIQPYIGQKGVIELTKKEAIAFSELNQKRTIKVVDQALVDLLKIKALRGMDFTKEEEAALDPDNSDGGFVKAEIFADQIRNH